MFEKEAEEYADNYNIMNEDLSPKSPRHIVLEVFKDGYRKAEKQLEYAKTIIQDLLDNSDEYARQRAMDFLEAKE